MIRLEGGDHLAGHRFGRRTVLGRSRTRHDAGEHGHGRGAERPCDRFVGHNGDLNLTAKRGLRSRMSRHVHRRPGLTRSSNTHRLPRLRRACRGCRGWFLSAGSSHDLVETVVPFVTRELVDQIWILLHRQLGGPVPMTVVPRSSQKLFLWSSPIPSELAHHGPGLGNVQGHGWLGRPARLDRSRRRW